MNTKAKRFPKKHTILLVIAIIFVGFNLRPAITSVGPLIGFIRDDLGLTNSQAGFITTVPLLAFAALSVTAPAFGKKVGAEWAIFIGLAVLFLGILMRSAGFITTLYIGTAIIGIGIALCNVLLPALVKHHFVKHTGWMTSVYSTSMGIFATLASGLSIPLAVNAGMGWQGSLVLWGILPLFGLLFLIYPLRLTKTDPQAESKIRKQPDSSASMWKSPLAWQITTFMGTQSLLFFSLITWLPEILQDNGLPLSTAGWLLAFMQICGLPSTFLTPILASRLKNQRVIVLVIGTAYVASMTGLLMGVSSIPGVTALMMLAGVSQGSAISFSFMLFTLRTTSADQAANLSGMAQSFGYLLGASGPLAIGFFFDFTGGATVPLLILLSAILMLTIAGVGASRDTYITPKKTSRETT